MSQVIVTNDPLKARREKTREQERRIDRESQFTRWRRSDITGPDPVAKLIGLAVLPILGLWGILCAVMTLALTVVNYVFKGLGRVIGGTRDLIRGDA